MSMIRWAALVIFAVIVVVGAQSAFGTVVSFDMTVIFEGPGVPWNPAPWVNATFDDGGSAGTVTLTLTTGGLAVGTEKVAVWYFNLDPALDPTQLVFSAPIKSGNGASPWFDDPIISKGVDSYQADGDYRIAYSE